MYNDPEGKFLPSIVCQKGGTFSKADAFPEGDRQRSNIKRNHFLKQEKEISEKGKPLERAGRKATGPKALAAMAARPPIFRNTLKNERRTK